MVFSDCQNSSLIHSGFSLFWEADSGESSALFLLMATISEVNLRGGSSSTLVLTSKAFFRRGATRSDSILDSDVLRRAVRSTPHPGFYKSAPDSLF